MLVVARLSWRPAAIAACAIPDGYAAKDMVVDLASVYRGLGAKSLFSIDSFSISATIPLRGDL